MNTAVILAAGRGSRLGRLTSLRSKGMLPILGRPAIERVMEILAAGGVENFILVRGPTDDEMVAYVEGRSAFKENTRIVVQAASLGSAYALACAAPLIEGDFIVSACDNLVDPAAIRRLRDRWEAERPEALLTLMEVPPQAMSSTGIVALDGPRVTRIVEKPALDQAPSNLASLPLYAFRPGLLELLPETPLSPRGEYELPAAIQLLIERGGLVEGLPVDSRLTLTTPADLLEINRTYLRAQVPHVKDRDGPNPGIAEIPGVILISPCYIEPGAAVAPGCRIGPEAYLEAGCQVGLNASVRFSALLRGAVVPAGAVVEYVVLPS
jgi:bifunctional UDP-N-acetylglucosamine pyrophosphorylase/glucosamine-1-phosphate N-acetyltransferase